MELTEREREEFYIAKASLVQVTLRKRRDIVFLYEDTYTDTENEHLVVETLYFPSLVKRGKVRWNGRDAKYLYREIISLYGELELETKEND